MLGGSLQSRSDSLERQKIVKFPGSLPFIRKAMLDCKRDTPTVLSTRRSSDVSKHLPSKIWLPLQRTNPLQLSSGKLQIHSCWHRPRMCGPFRSLSLRGSTRLSRNGLQRLSQSRAARPFMTFPKVSTSRFTVSLACRSRSAAASDAARARSAYTACFACFLAPRSAAFSARRAIE